MSTLDTVQATLLNASTCTVDAVLRTFAVAGFRSLRELVVPLESLNIVTGANSSGKSNFYRALRLLADVAHDGAVRALAAEGGLPSTLWAGPEQVGRAVRSGEHPVQGTVRRQSVSLKLGLIDDEFGFAIDFGLPSVDQSSLFTRDPEIKREVAWVGEVLRPSATTVDRRHDTVWVRDPSGDWPEHANPVDTFDSVLSEFVDPVRSPELAHLRSRMRSWRFYDQFRTDRDSPARAAHIGTRTFAVADDGADLASATQTIVEVGDEAALASTIDMAFPGSHVAVANREGWFELQFHQRGLLRPLNAAELSDGTLRYLLWTAALLTPRPPALLVLNEPENSLHPELLQPLAQLIVSAASRTQVIVVSHSRELLAAIYAAAGDRGVSLRVANLVKAYGETTIKGQDLSDTPAWRWPRR